ncbi:MAG: hypothetical protein V4519_01900 [Patescibacteria group bacterium]
MLTWINFLHIYQPPTQSKEIVDLVVRESYETIVRVLNSYPKLKITLNISGSLIELLEKNGHQNLLADFKKLAEEKRIELVGSAMYHPLLALLPESEIVRQIELHNEISKRYFGDAYNPKGFFIPEMAYSKKVADIVEKMGFTWLILDGMHAASVTPNPEVHYTIEGTNLSVVFRDREFSKTFPPEFIVENKDKIQHSAIVIAHDGELYGHWHKDDRGYYQKAFQESDIQFKTISDYISGLQISDTIKVQEGSWESLPAEISANVPYALWNNPSNMIHSMMWSFARFVLTTIEHHSQDQNYISSRHLLDQGLASCAWWWATSEKLVATSPICWNPTEIEKGAALMLLALRSLRHADDEKIIAEKSFGELRTLIWITHWQYEKNNKIL